MKKRLVWVVLILAVLVVLGYFAPGIYWRATGTWRGEVFYDGRPTSYWREQIKAEEVRQARQAAFFFGGAPITWRDKVEEWRERWLHGDDNRIETLKKDVDAAPVWRELMRDDDVSIRIARGW